VQCEYLRPRPCGSWERPVSIPLSPYVFLARAALPALTAVLQQKWDGRFSRLRGKASGVGGFAFLYAVVGTIRSRLSFFRFGRKAELARHKVLIAFLQLTVVGRASEVSHGASPGRGGRRRQRVGSDVSAFFYLRGARTAGRRLASLGKMD